MDRVVVARRKFGRHQVRFESKEMFRSLLTMTSAIENATNLQSRPRLIFSGERQTDDPHPPAAAAAAVAAMTAHPQPFSPLGGSDCYIRPMSIWYITFIPPARVNLRSQRPKSVAFASQTASLVTDTRPSFSASSRFNIFL